MKERLDLLLVDRGLFPTREKAKAAIMAGEVFVNKQISDKPGTAIDQLADIEIKDTGCPYVGRGGLKLKKALDVFDIDLTGLIAADFGASTGGFTDCMLKEGALRVYSIDVGYGQLDYRLRTDERVVTMERMNIRYLEEEAIPEKLDFISIDVSFISLSLILPVAFSFLKEGGRVVCLVKPQFEAGRELVGKNGIVRDKSVHIDVLQKVVNYGNQTGLHSRSLTFSPITGAKGNIEYLLLLVKEPIQTDESFEVEAAVDAAHSTHTRRGL